MYYLILITLIGISFAPFPFFKLDIWHAQGFWVQFMIMVMYSWSFFEKPKQVKITNVPLGILHLWIGGLTAVTCFASQMSGKYNIMQFFPYFNFLCLLIFYKICVQYLNRDKIEKILVWLKYMVLVHLFMCVLQKFGLAQFFELLETTPNIKPSMVIGFLGNGTHLSGFLGMCVPLFLLKPKREDYLSLILMMIVMSLTGTLINDPSISGYIVSYILILVYMFVSNREMFTLIVLSSILLVSWCFMKDLVSKNLFSDTGRFELWKYYWNLFKLNSPITGVGLGKINQLYTKTTFPTARHLHLEYFQFMFETGIIGAVAILNLIVGFFRKGFHNKTQFILMLIVLGFLLSCCFNYPAHLWLPSTIAMFAYAAYFAIENEEQENAS